MGKIKKTISLFLILVVLGGVIGFAQTEYVHSRVSFCVGDCSPPEAVQTVEIDEVQFMHCKLIYSQGFDFDFVCFMFN